MSSYSMNPRSFEILRHLARELVALSPSEREALSRLFVEEAASASMQALAEAGAALPVREQAVGDALIDDFLASLGLCAGEAPLSFGLGGDDENGRTTKETGADRTARGAAPVVALVRRR